MITGMFAFRPARNISERSRLTASRGNAGTPIPSEKGPASVVPASQAIKCGACANASSNAAPLIPPPTLPTGDMNRICSNCPFAISAAFPPPLANRQTDLDLSEPAVDVDFHPCDVGGILRGQECYGPGDFFRLSKPLHRNLRNQQLRKFIDGFF